MSPKSAIATIIAGFLVSIAIMEVLDSDQFGDYQSPIRIDGDGLGPDADNAELMTLDPVAAIRRAVLTRYVDGTLTLDGLRDVLSEQRLEVNAVLIERTVMSRGRWLHHIQVVLHWSTLVFCLWLLGPLWLAWRDPKGRRMATITRSIPYFTATTAALLFMSASIVDMTFQLQGLQVAVLAVGSPNVAVTDAVIHALIHSNDEQLRHLLGLLVEARAVAASDPLAAVGMLQPFYEGAQAVSQSTHFARTLEIWASFGWLLSLNAPLLGVGGLVILVRVSWPVISTLAQYPVEVMDGVQRGSVWAFVKQQLVLLIRVIRAGIMLTLLILILSALAVAVQRLLCFPLAATCLNCVLAATRIFESTGQLPDLALQLALISTGLFLVLATICSLGAVGIVLTKGSLVVWTHVQERRRWRSFPQFWRLLGDLILGVVLLSALAGGVIFAVHVGLNAAFMPADTTSIWLVVPLYGPMMLGLLWRLGVFGRLRRTMLLNVIGDASVTKSTGEPPSTLK